MLTNKKKQGGVVLAVTLFMLALLTIIGVSAVMLSTTHFRIVGNLQSSNEAEMAMRFAIENFISAKDIDGSLKDLECEQCLYPVCVYGHRIDVTVTSVCTGRIPSLEGSLKSPQIDGSWDIRAIANNQTTSAIHWGVITPKRTCNPLPAACNPTTSCSKTIPTLPCPN